MRILVTGATGYIGGRLVPRLLEAGHDVRVLVRTPAKLRDVPWADRVEVITGDLQNADDVVTAVDGIDLIYYLVHGMGGSKNFEELEVQCAHNVADAASEAGVKRIVYLGGLHPEGELSPHLRCTAFA